jgi:hypothetical protein
MSFADRLKQKLSGGTATAVVAPVPEPVAAAVPVTLPPIKANNDNNFIPTKYGEELPHAVRAYLPRVPGAAAVAPAPVTVNIADETLFPSLGPASATPKTNTSMNRSGSSWADKAREWAAQDAADTTQDDNYV